MKKILVPTDFSTIADNATKYAIEIAAKFKSEIYLYHVYSFDRFNYDLNFGDDEQPFTKKMKRFMNRTKRKFMGDITEKGLSIQTMVEQTDIFSLFGEKVKKHGIDLIVMGSKGASGFTKVVFGSVAATAMEIAKVPVLVIPPVYTFRSLEQIVLAIDNREVAPNVLSPIQKLALKFGAKVTLLNVKVGLDKNAHGMVHSYLDGVETIYREVPMSKSINETINRFIQEEGCDLLCMIRREKGFLESIFQKSITKAQVYNNRVPLLVLPENSKALGA